MMVKNARIVAACVAVVGLGVVGCSQEQDSAPAKQGNDVAASSSANAPKESAEDSPYRYPAEDLVAQRRWPRGAFDDSSFRPGRWSITTTGQPIYTPINPLGEPLGEPTKANEISDCRPEATRAPNKVNIQYIHGRYILFSESDGPGGVDSDGIPTDYALTPAGAALAMYNFIDLLMPAHDEISRKADERLLLGDEHFYDKEKKNDVMMPPFALPEAFKVEECAGNIVTITLAIPLPVDDDGNPVKKETWGAFISTLVWEDGQWKIQPTEGKNKYGDEAMIYSIDGFAKLRYQ